MPVWPSDYVEYVLKDIEKYNGVRKIAKAGLIERFAVRFCSPKRLHPNPEDEFSMENVGPNMQIVGDYVEQIKIDLVSDQDVFHEPVIVQKMKPDGYILINGHHRWFAALRMRVKKLHIKIVNMINAEDLSRMIGATANSKLATFDFDEVLLSNRENNQDSIINRIFSRKFKERLRLGAADTVKTLRDKGYDICVYSAGYLSEDEFNDFFSMYDIKVDVIVNGVNEKRTNTAGIKDLLKDKYKMIAHIDNESVIISDHVKKDYEIFDIEDYDKSWSEGIKKIV